MAEHMPDDGMQCVMFTHQDTGVWGDLIGIFWAAGLQVVAAWYIATETTSELKKGGYVQGTVILMLKKRAAGERTGFKQRLLPAVRQEVAHQIESMMHLNDTVKTHHGEPVFNDSDLQMAGYAAALKVLTAYKRMVAEHQIRVMVATDAACEGLNLQTLGTLINIDLPWNPTRLEQRIGRIKRFGQRRDTVDMLNLVFEQTVDEKIYERLSERMKNRYDLFGSLPDTIKDEWIEDIETLGERLDEYINAQKTATGFDLRYTGTMMPPEKDWREFTEVLSRRDLATLMSTAWS
jgi:hypothetical protein